MVPSSIECVVKTPDFSEFSNILEMTFLYEKKRKNINFLKQFTFAVDFTKKHVSIVGPI